MRGVEVLLLMGRKLTGVRAGGHRCWPVLSLPSNKGKCQPRLVSIRFFYIIHHASVNFSLFNICSNVAKKC